jgi:P4 family phage/plasmid primase-like protien
MNQDILQQQKVWLDKLQEHSKKPILIKALEGKVPNELKNSNASGLYCWSYYKDVFHMLQAPYFTRSILVNEIVFDPDTQIWDDLKQELDKIISTLQKLEIPYLLAHSGGKGCHVHIFFDMHIDIPNDLFVKAKESNFDVYKAFRQHIFEYVMNESNANIDLLKIDKPKINWQIFSMGSQVRDFGTARNGGFFKTLIDEVPINRPLAPLPLVFPEKIQLWKIPSDHIQTIMNKIKTGIVRQAKYNKQTIPANHGIRKTEELPCIANIMNGLDAGRYYGAGAIALASKEIGSAWQEAEPQVELFLSRCRGLSSSDIILRVENSKHLYDSEKVFSCKWIKENLKCPKPSECIITIKRKEQKEKTNDENNHLSIADNIFTTGYFCTLKETDEILHYENGIYERYGEHFIQSEAQRINDDISTHEVNEIVNYIKRKTFISIKELNKHKHLIALNNGYYNLGTCQLEPYDPSVIITIKVPITFNPLAKCPNIDTFFNEVVAQDDIQAIEEFFGYCLLRDYPIQKAFMLVGAGGNGKSTLIIVLKHFLGEHNVCSVALQELEENHFAAANLFGKLANMYADLPPHALESTGKIKMLTGGDHITVERKFGDFFEYVNYAKMIFSTNKLPMSYDDTDAFYRRWIIINFPNKFSETDGKGLVKKLTTEEELSGLFNTAILGYKRLIENSKFSGQKNVENIREQYIRLSDSVQAFVMDCIDISAEGWIEKKVLYKIYGAYCKANKIPISSENRFFSRIGFYIRVEDYKTQNSDRKRVHAFKGIVFKIDINSFYYTDNLSTMSKMSSICTAESILNYTENNNIVQQEHNREKGGLDGQGITNIVTELDKEDNCVTQSLVLEKGSEFQAMKHQNITSSNILEFSMWFCDQTGCKSPEEVKTVASKVFALTPVPQKKEPHLSFLCKNNQCKDCGGIGCECGCHERRD